MKKQLITIDIYPLGPDQLKQLESIAYFNGDMRTVKQIYLRRAFIEGWTDEDRSEQA